MPSKLLFVLLLFLIKKAPFCLKTHNFLQKVQLPQRLSNQTSYISTNCTEAKYTQIIMFVGHSVFLCCRVNPFAMYERSHGRKTKRWSKHNPMQFQRSQYGQWCEASEMWNRVRSTKINSYYTVASEEWDQRHTW